MEVGGTWEKIETTDQKTHLISEEQMKNEGEQRGRVKRNSDFCHILLLVKITGRKLKI